MNMKKSSYSAVYPGSFDPFTMGHLDILKKALPLFDKIYIGVLNNPAKKAAFTIEEKIEIINKILEAEHIENVEVCAFGGLTVDFCEEKGANYIIRGLRSVTDFEYEFQLRAVNRHMSQNIDTMFFMSSVKYSYLSSSIVREMAENGADIATFVHPATLDMINNKLHKKENNG